MEDDFLIFIRYFLNTLKPKFELRSIAWLLSILSILLMIEAIISLFLLKSLININPEYKLIIIGIIFIIIFILKTIQIYKSGMHRFWYNQLKGVPSKSQIIEMKKAYKNQNLKENENMPTM